MCGIWDWQSTIVKDLNDSQDPKHTLICRENAFIAIYALFSDNKCPLFTGLGGGSPKADIVHFFDRFSYMMASLTLLCCATIQCLLCSGLIQTNSQPISWSVATQHRSVGAQLYIRDNKCERFVPE